MKSAISVNQQWCSEAWDMVWGKLWYPGTKLFYDYIPSTGDIIADLPTVEEIAGDIPNPNGWQTGMEDSMLNAGNMLECLISRWQIDGDPEAGRLAAEVFAGMSNCADHGRSPGFLPRSLSPADGKSHYTNSSRDQYTHFIFASWLYFHSGMADEKEKAAIIRHLKSFAERCRRNVIPENNYDIMREDDVPGDVAAMMGSQVNWHEIMRLPMFYLAAWDVSGEEKYRSWYKEVLPDALAFNETISFERHWEAFELLQMQYSLRLIHDVEIDCGIKERVAVIMRQTADHCGRYICDITEFEPFFDEAPEPWRDRVFHYRSSRPIGGKAYMVPWIKKEFRIKCYSVLRSLGEGMLVMLLTPGCVPSPEKIALFNEMASRINYRKHHSYAPLLLLDGWYKLHAVLKNNFCAVSDKGR